MNIRNISERTVISGVKELVLKCNTQLPMDVLSSIKQCLKSAGSAQEKNLLDIMVKNARIAKAQRLPLCQDTGISIFFVEMGNVKLSGTKTIQQMMDAGVKKAYGTKKLRPSILSDAFNGHNTKDNTPSVVHIENKKGN
ncbi:MAG: fumarate hydratase, partial [Pseudomonadota bacterium]